MSKTLKYRLKKIGSPPGTLIYTGNRADKSTALSLIIYDAGAFIEKNFSTFEEMAPFLKKNEKTWIHVSGITDSQLVNALGCHYGLHPLLLEDIMSPSQRSKLDDYKEHIYIAMRLMRYVKGILEDEQFSIVFGKDLLITFSEKASDILSPVKERLQKRDSRMRQRGADYLAYAVLDCIVDNYFQVLQNVDQNLESLENELFYDLQPKTLHHIQATKKELANLRKNIWPMREVLNQFRKTESPLVSDSTQMYAYDVYDHTLQAIETIETFRELISGFTDIYLSMINQKMNEVMKVLAMVATIFVPLTFISSLYGMNFEHMPELRWAWGYPLVLASMAVVTLLMVYIFRRKRWI